MVYVFCFSSYFFAQSFGGLLTSGALRVSGLFWVKPRVPPTLSLFSLSVFPARFRILWGWRPCAFFWRFSPALASFRHILFCGLLNLSSSSSWNASLADTHSFLVASPVSALVFSVVSIFCHALLERSWERPFGPISSSPSRFLIRFSSSYGGCFLDFSHTVCFPSPSFLARLFS